MSKLDVFEIKLEKPGRPILSGGVVRGDVVLWLKKEVDIARVMVHLYGGGHVEFHDAQGSGVSSRGAVCEDSEVYVRQTQIVYARSDPSGRRLGRGDQCRWPFEFHLPADLPSSFMTVVFYKVTAFLDCGGKSHEVTCPIVVVNDFDLSRYSGRLTLAEPIDTWSPSRSRLDSGLVTARLVTNKRGYIFGETLNMHIEVYNNSKAKLENLNACLVQKGTLKAFSASGAQYRRVHWLLVKRIPLGKLRNGERLHLEDVNLQVPWVVTSDMERHTRLIEIEYYLQVVTTSIQVVSAVTGASLSQRMCIGPDYRKSELVGVLLEEQIAIGVRQLRAYDPRLLAGQQAPMMQQQGLYPSLNGAAAAAVSMPTVPPPDSSDLAMFTMMPTAPPSYDEALTHDKAPLTVPGGDS